MLFNQGNGISKNILRDLAAKHGECFARARRTVREHAAVVALEHYVDEILQIILRKTVRKTVVISAFMWKNLFRT
jgi:hypothetical protein